jgi:signal transduction histidine kinase
LTQRPSTSADSSLHLESASAQDANDRSGSGLIFHRTMLTLIGGSLSIEERSGGGTQVSIEVPS